MGNHAMPEQRSERSTPLRGQPPEAIMQAIAEALKGVQFGQITLIVQDGQVIQIDRMERKRLTN
jgi:hypothetical protein